MTLLATSLCRTSPACTASQVLLLVAAVLGVLATRHGRLRDERVRARLVGVAALGYAGMFAALTWQAWRGQPVLRPDAQTVIAFSGVAAPTVPAAAAVVIRRGAGGPRLIVAADPRSGRRAVDAGPR